jgi:AraC family transcriptional regulator
MKRSMLTVGSAKPTNSEQIDSQELFPRLTHAPVLSNQQIVWQGLNFLEFNHPSYRIGEHIQEYHSVAISLAKGVAKELTIDRRSYNSISSIGDVSIVPAKSTRSVAWVGNAAFALLTLSPEFVREVASELIDSNMVELIPQHVTQDPLIYQIALSLKQDIETGYPTGKLFGESAATMLVVRLLQQYAVRRPKQPIDEHGLSIYILRQVLEYIQVHLSQDLSIAELAQMVGMSTYYFIRLFKKSMHITPRQYIIHQRVERAKALLRSRDLPIIEVASQCGFTSQSHFTTMFRQATKTTPKAYQQGLM